MRIYVLITFLLLGSLGQAQPTLVDKVLAVVGDKIVLLSDVELARLRFIQEGQPPADLRCDILDQLLGQKMLLTQAELDSVMVGEDQVDYELDRRMDYFVQLLGGVSELEVYYGKSIEEMKEDLRPDIAEQLVAQKMQGVITEDIDITPNEVREYFKSIPKDSLPVFPAQVQLGQIVMYPEVTTIQKQLAIELAQDIRDKIEGGRSFCSMVALHSDDEATKQDCGELPEFGKKDGYAKEFVAASFKLQDGALSEVVETEFGYHLIQMIKRSGERVKVRHLLIRPEITALDLERAHQKLDSIRTLLVNGELGFTQAAVLHSKDEMTEQSNGMILNQSTGDNWFDLTSLGALDPDLPFIIEEMTEGDYSPVKKHADFRGDEGVRLIWLKKEQPAHVASMKDDYPRIKEEALALKKLDVTEDWLRERVQKTYIKIDDSFADCDILQPWTQ